MKRELTQGDKNVVANLRGSFGVVLDNYTDETLAYAWRIFSQSDEYTGHPNANLICEWCDIAKAEMTQ